MDISGSCDPYVVVRVGDDELDTKTRQTAVVKETQAPVWNEKFEIGLSEEEAEGGGEEKVFVQVWDWDQFGANDMVGECAIYLSTILKKDSSSPKWYTIYGFRDDTASGVGKVGQVYLSLKIQPPRAPPVTRTLEVLVSQGKDLKAMDSNGSSDPYLTLELAGRKESWCKTSVVKRALNPVWEERFDLTVGEEDLALLVQVWDKDFFGSDDLIGSCTVDLSSLDVSAQQPAHHEAMIADTSDYADDPVWHTLHDASGAVAGKVSLTLRLGAPATIEPSTTVREGAGGDRDAVDGADACLKIKAVSGRALKAMDRGGTSDPYLVFFIGKEASVVARTKRCQTKVVKKTCNPEWNESLVIEGLRQGEVASEFVTGLSAVAFVSMYVGSESCSFSCLPRASCFESYAGRFMYMSSYSETKVAPLMDCAVEW